MVSWLSFSLSDDKKWEQAIDGQKEDMVYNEQSIQ